MEKRLELFDLVKAFGKQDYVILDSHYKSKLANHPLVRALWTVGSHFVLVSNMQTWDTELVTGDIREISGYSKQEAEDLKAEFAIRFSAEQDLSFNLQVVKLGMEYLHQQPEEQRDSIYAVYFYRAVKKGGQVITVQHQSIPILFDENKVPFVFSNIFTDISFLGVTRLPQALMVNRYTNETFHIQPHSPELVKLSELFSPREKEVIQCLVAGQTSRQIGKRLHISMETVRTHRKNILNRSGLKNTAELVTYALTHGVV